jgi:ribosomal protein L35AE/L33A
MSEKSMDKKNRWRNVTVAFRMSKEENEELEMRVKLMGFRTRQEYIIQSLLYQKVLAKGNPLMLVQFRKHLQNIEAELKRIDNINEVGEEFFTPIRTMAEILEAFQNMEEADDELESEE